jgi:tRNA (guanine37-N1)-methyltransferase
MPADAMVHSGLGCSTTPSRRRDLRRRPADCPHTRARRNTGATKFEVLLSGHHAAIRRWRLKQSLGRTWERRAELLQARTLSSDEAALLAEYRREREEAAGREAGN